MPRITTLATAQCSGTFTLSTDDVGATWHSRRSQDPSECAPCQGCQGSSICAPSSASMALCAAKVYRRRHFGDAESVRFLCKRS